jgi:hypothetical protein
MLSNDEDSREGRTRMLYCISGITALVVVLAVAFAVLNVLHMLNVFASADIQNAV